MAVSAFLYIKEKKISDIPRIRLKRDFDQKEIQLMSKDLATPSFSLQVNKMYRFASLARR